MTKDEVLKLALEALESFQEISDFAPAQAVHAITAIKEALAQPAQEPVAIHCKAKRENNGVCPNHNLQCGWPKCNEPPTPVKIISSEQLSAMFQNLKGIDTSQSGYHWRVGYNAALRQAMDYSMPLYTTPPAPQQSPWVGLTEVDVLAESKHWRNPEDFLNGVYWAECTLKEKNT